MVMTHTHTHIHTHTHKLKFKCQSVKKIYWKQTDRPKDATNCFRQEEDCFTFPANAVDNHHVTARRPDIRLRRSVDRRCFVRISK